MSSVSLERSTPPTPMEAQDECCICTDYLGRDITLLRTLPCNHILHIKCAKALAQWQEKCPLCRAPAAAHILDSQIKLPPQDDDDRAILTQSLFADPIEEEEEDLEVFDDDQPIADAPLAYVRADLEVECIGPDENLDALIKIRAPRTEHADNQQTSMDVLVVADVSESMNYDGKIGQVKQTLAWLTDELQPHQRLSLITFNGHARRITPFTPMNAEGKRIQNQALHSLQVGGNTDIGKALQIADRVLTDRHEPNPVSLVILLTDGQDANAYESTRDSIASIKQKAHMCFLGLGQQHDARLLSELQQRSNGTFVYCPDAQTIPQTAGGFIGAARKAAALNVEMVIQPGHEMVRFPLFTEEQEHCSLIRLEQPVTVQVRYKQPGSNQEKVVEYQSIKKAVSQEDRILINSHKNRELVRVALQVAATPDDESRRALEDVLAQLKASISKDTPITVALIADCEKALAAMDAPDFEQGGSQIIHAALSNALSQSALRADSVFATPNARHASQSAQAAVQRVNQNVHARRILWE